MNGLRIHIHDQTSCVPLANKAWNTKEFIGYSYEIPGFPRKLELHFVRGLVRLIYLGQ